jgi:hypothetical protein
MEGGGPAPAEVARAAAKPVEARKSADGAEATDPQPVIPQAPPQPKITPQQIAEQAKADQAALGEVREEIEDLKDGKEAVDPREVVRMGSSDHAKKVDAASTKKSRGSSAAAEGTDGQKVDPTKDDSGHRAEITDKLGDKYDVEYLRTEGESHLMDDPRVQKMIADVLAINKLTMPDIDESNIRAKLNGCNGIDIVRTKSGEPVAYHAYKFKDIPEYGPEAKVMYTFFANVVPQYEGRRLTELSRIPAIDIENPDVITGSTVVPAIYITNRRIAESKGYVMYPEPGVMPPPQIVDFGRQMFDTLGLKGSDGPGHSINDKLFRRRDNPVNGKGGLPFELAPNEQIFYVMVKPELNSKIINTPQIAPAAPQSASISA